MSPFRTLHYKNRAIFNTIGYVLVILINMLAALQGINGKRTAAIANEYSTLFMPADITFFIWGLIYLALLGFVIYQLWLAFSGRRAELAWFMQRMRGWWLVSCLANTCWLFAWHYDLLPVALLLMLALFISLLAIQLNFNIAITPAPQRERLLVHLPFSLYLGWAVMATAANIGALLVYTGWDGNPLPPGLILLAACALAYLLLVVQRNNLVAGLTGLWGFYGIFARQQELAGPAAQPVTTGCIIAAGLLLVTMVWRWKKLIYYF